MKNQFLLSEAGLPSVNEKDSSSDRWQMNEPTENSSLKQAKTTERAELEQGQTIKQRKKFRTQRKVR
jgi:hypothetical protein